MSETSIWLNAVRKNLCFSEFGNGRLLPQDLWHLGLEDLDRVYQQISETLAKSGNFSLLGPAKVDPLLSLKRDLIEEVIKTRVLEDEEKRNRQKEREQKLAYKQLLLQAKAAQRESAVMSMSPEEIDAALAELD